MDKGLRSAKKMEYEGARKQGGPARVDQKQVALSEHLAQAGKSKPLYMWALLIRSRQRFPSLVGL